MWWAHPRRRSLRTEQNRPQERAGEWHRGGSHEIHYNQLPAWHRAFGEKDRRTAQGGMGARAATRLDWGLEPVTF